MAVSATIARFVGSWIASKAFRRFGAALAFRVLHKLAAQTENTLDDELVQIAEDVYYGRDTTRAAEAKGKHFFNGGP